MIKVLALMFLLTNCNSVEASPGWAKKAFKCNKRSVRWAYRMEFGGFECEKGFRNNQDQNCILKVGWCIPGR